MAWGQNKKDNKLSDEQKKNIRKINDELNFGSKKKKKKDKKK